MADREFTASVQLPVTLHRDDWTKEDLQGALQHYLQVTIEEKEAEFGGTPPFSLRGETNVFHILGPIGGSET